MRRDRNWLEGLGALEHARKLLEDGDLGSARELLEQERTRARGSCSAYVLWKLAVACDRMEDFDMALKYVEEAIARDPMALPIHRSFDSITEHIRKVLTSGPKDTADDPAIPKLYQLLLSAGEASAECHVVMARFSIATGDTGNARRLLDAVTTLDPGSAPAWEALLELGLKIGADDLVRQARAELAGLGEGGALFGVVEVANG